MVSTVKVLRIIQKHRLLEAPGHGKIISSITMTINEDEWRFSWDGHFFPKKILSQQKRQYLSFREVISTV